MVSILDFNAAKMIGGSGIIWIIYGVLLQPTMNIGKL